LHVRIALSAVCSSRASGRVEDEHRDRAGGEPRERLLLDLALGIAGRGDLDGEAPGQYLVVRPTSSARALATKAASGARTVSGRA
jgi:hypothetical protein